MSPRVRDSFRRLAIEFGLMKFGAAQVGSCGFAVIELLGWKNFDCFKSDLLLLG
jgi:hypothetical protein